MTDSCRKKALKYKYNCTNYFPTCQLIQLIVERFDGVVELAQMTCQLLSTPYQWPWYKYMRQYIPAVVTDSLVLLSVMYLHHGPLARYVQLRVAHAPRMPGTFSSPQWVSNPDMHHDTGVTQVPRCMPGSLTSGFHWSRWQGKRSRHSRRMRNP